MKQNKEFQHFIFYFGRFEITFNPKYDYPTFKCNPYHDGLYALLEQSVRETRLAEVYIDEEKQLLYAESSYKVMYEGVVMY